jgi:acyl-CoA reductase-like NAD-dependent aldehyde dehydrogenase
VNELILRRAFDLMTARRDELARIITLENGKARGPTPLPR